MTKYLILITILIILYLYWKYQQNKTLPQDEIIERKGKNKETFWDYDLTSDSDEENQTVNQGVIEFPSAKLVPVNKKEANQWQTERQTLTEQLTNLQTMVQPLNINNLTKKDLTKLKDLVAEINNQWLSK